MKTTLIPAVVLLSAATLAPPAFAGLPQETERIDRTVPIRANGELRLHSFSGKVTITGSNRADVSIHAVRRASRDRLDHIKLEISETAYGVSIEANKTDYGSSERDTFSGDVELNGAWGSIDANTFSGNVTVKLANAAGGHLEFSSFSGALRSDVPLTYHSGNHRRINGDIGSGSNDYHFKTFSGDVRIR
jgi:DUF4097 and DUF4098 domain-containing protein YvlB